MKQHSLLFIALVLCCSLLFQSCATVKPYQRQYLNDYEMQTGRKPEEKFEDYVYKIREGSSDAGSFKTAGGCGCN